MLRMTPNHFYRLCLGTLAFIVLVIVWGALVRATGSGAGCGEHWPLCNGEMLPTLSRYQTIIEFTHRATSGLSLLLVFTVGHYAFRLYGRGHLMRKLALWSMVAIVIEALIGAALVLLRLVEHDRSADRAVSIALHLGNTCFLVGVMTLTTWVAGRLAKNPTESIAFFPPASPARRQALGTLVGFVILAATGALTALGDTLFEVSSFQEGWVRDWAKDAHFLERLRIFHPMLALGWLALAIVWLQSLSTPWARRAIVLILVNMTVGAANVLLAAPVSIQLIHLLVANLLWIALVLSFVESADELSQAPAGASVST